MKIMRKMKIVVFIIIWFLGFGLAHSEEVKIDGSSVESTYRSFDQLYSPLSSEDQNKLLVALIRIQLAGFDGPDEVPDELHGQINLEFLSTKIDGMNFEEILALSEKSQTKAEMLN